MPQAKDPSLGINSWLEDDLYHQYQFDRKSVDEGWAHLFQEGGQNGDIKQNGDARAETLGAVAAAAPNVPRQEPPERIPPEKEPPSQPPSEREPPKPTVPESDPSPAEPARQDPSQPSPRPQEAATVQVTKSSTAAEPAKQEVKSVGANEQLIPLRGVAARIAENMAASLSIPVATSQRQIPVRVIEENRNVINKQRAIQGRGKLSFTHLIAWAIVKAIKSNPSLNHAFAENGGEIFRVVRNQVNIGLA
ncbi:MAG TPA: 2-oxo acid dehydrogenase subunit E2, partial [Bryobacteraceae bacterium]|nr:2-oxo acid dehydrogenase subunit E2 [Bryobacteraceae bacterium]